MGTAFSAGLNGDGFFKWVEWERLFFFSWVEWDRFFSWVEWGPLFQLG
jgi:hypothetical protein